MGWVFHLLEATGRIFTCRANMSIQMSSQIHGQIAWLSLAGLNSVFSVSEAFRGCPCILCPVLCPCSIPLSCYRCALCLQDSTSVWEFQKGLSYTTQTPQQLPFFIKTKTKPKPSNNTVFLQSSMPGWPSLAMCLQDSTGCQTLQCSGVLGALFDTGAHLSAGCNCFTLYICMDIVGHHLACEKVIRIQGCGSTFFFSVLMRD